MRVVHAETRLPEVVDVLVDAFRGDLVPTWMFRERANDSLVPSFRASSKLFAKYGQVLGAEDEEGRLQGALLLHPPGVTLSNFHWARAGFWRHLFRFGPRAFRRLVSYGRHADTLLEPRYAIRPHFYVDTLGVRKEAQGRGVGRLLMEAVFEQAARVGQPLMLLTHQERNIRFYERLGYQITATSPLPQSDVLTRLMVRSPA